MSNELAEDVFINEKFYDTFAAVLYLVFHL
jgi:hypothetical protein